MKFEFASEAQKRFFESKEPLTVFSGGYLGSSGVFHDAMIYQAMVNRINSAIADSIEMIPAKKEDE